MTTANQTDAQMKLADVTQADREAAADFFECSTFAGRDAFLRGDEDSSDVVQAFAKHRQATEARAQGLVEALEDVINPLGALKREADAQGAQLSGMAYSISNDIGYIKGIAHQALATWRRT